MTCLAVVWTVPKGKWEIVYEENPVADCGGITSGPPEISYAWREVILYDRRWTTIEVCYPSF